MYIITVLRSGRENDTAERSESHIALHDLHDKHIKVIDVVDTAERLNILITRNIILIKQPLNIHVCVCVSVCVHHAIYICTHKSVVAWYQLLRLAQHKRRHT